MTDLIGGRSQHKKNDLTIVVGLTAVILFFAASGILSYYNTRTLSRDALLVTHTHEVIINLEEIFSALKDAETGQRGFVLTGNEDYLEPYDMALNHITDKLEVVAGLTKDNPVQQQRLPSLRTNIKAKLDELAETINLRRNKGFEAARALVVTNRGKNFMDAVRSQISDMQQDEKELRNKRFAEMDSAYYSALVSGILSGVLGIVLAAMVSFMIRKAATVRQRQEWLQTGEVTLSSALVGEQKIEQLGQNILKFFADYFGAHAGAFFTHEGDVYKRKASYGLPAENHMVKEFRIGHTLLGQAVKDKKTFLINDVPDGYIRVASAMGQSSPRQLIISPAISDDTVNAVIELGFINPVDELSLELLERVSENISMAVRSANYREHLQNLLEETQRQSEELQAQGEELRVSNEELEEQSRALKESQSRLEQQQLELEQTNAQLEEQAQQLENQRDDVERSKSQLQVKAQELEKASQYKSDFLANMSHELRTPLNSSLILAKLLADNPAGNLSEEQVKFAQTIQNSGNSLLSLINDILDLSKIEAGHMEVRPESVSLDRMVKDLTANFEPVAKQKKISFKTKISADCPEFIESDRMRLEQVIKNLISNSLKFTEKGSVELSISKDTDGKIEFSVTDTGIGIAEEQQNAIFEAFRQADGTISRKYGGTGLGLSISRELVRLLGGKISLKSKPGKGSTFTITLPENYNPEAIMPHTTTAYDSSASVQTSKDIISAAENYSKKEEVRKVAPLHDDREKLAGDKRTLLIVEDDRAFAEILYKLSHELNFQSLMAATAEDALTLAKQYLPNAVLLDISLPDNSGLSVLDRLKRDPRTRHIPVHVVSANDYTQTALSLGAVGYMLKPVKRDELIGAMKKLETRFEQRMRRVLIVEDDKVQLDSMQKLLGKNDVKTVGVRTAADCLHKLKKDKFDCMVLDLSLPDASGYSLLETLSKEDAYSFPPVIVYTGRDLSTDEEQKLRKYSKSIIIKGAKSPERLLDEVTLFLHQVVSELPPEQQKMIEKARNRDAILESRRILIVEDDVANIYALTSILEPYGAVLRVARNGKEALEILNKYQGEKDKKIDLVLMDVMMPEMDGITATREIRKNKDWKKLPIIMLTAKAMRDDQQKCLDAGANDYMAKPLDVDKLLSLVRVWMPR